MHTSKSFLGPTKIIESPKNPKKTQKCWFRAFRPYESVEKLFLAQIRCWIWNQHPKISQSKCKKKKSIRFYNHQTYENYENISFYGGLSKNAHSGPIWVSKTFFEFFSCPQSDFSYIFTIVYSPEAKHFSIFSYSGRCYPMIHSHPNIA